MPYAVTPAELKQLGDALAKYYEEAWDAGVKSRFDMMARSNMGIATGYLDQASDTYANFKKKSSDSFLLTFKPAVTQQIKLYFANKNDVASDMVSIAEKVLNFAVSKIPLPHVGQVLSAAISFGAGKAQTELHERSIKEADSQIVGKGGAATQTMFINDTQAADLAKKSIDTYKTIAKLVTTMPSDISTLDDAISYPGMVWKVQQSVSSLNVTVEGLKTYLAAMSGRLEETKKLSKQGIDSVRNGMTQVASDVVFASYNKGKEKGQADIMRKRFTPVPIPVFKQASMPGGASQLAARVAHALAQGYYDSGNTGPIAGNFMPPVRPRR